MEMVMKPDRICSRVSDHEPARHSARFPGDRRLSRHAAPFLAAAAFAVSLAAGDGSASAQGTQAANLDVSATVVRKCTIATSPVAFGNYDALAGLALDKPGAIKLTCTRGTVATITLDNGKTPQEAQRAMAGGTPAGFLNYELYFDNYGGTRWGATSGQIFTAPSAPSNLEQSFTVYGRILSGQTGVSQGTYADVVLATVNF
jgi:spore coat protein U-like protein